MGFFSKLNKLRKGLFSSIYINEKSNISDEQYKKIAIGALYSEQQTAYINSLTTGLNKSELINGLAEWWGISNSDEANETLQYLVDKGFRYYFDIVMKAYKNPDYDQHKNIIIKEFESIKDNYESYGDWEEDVIKAYDQLTNLQDTWDSLEKNKIISNVYELEKYKNIGWDCGRLVYLSRMCFDTGYITENETWNYIDKAYKLATDNFNTWEEFSKSYIIGRGMWGGLNSANEGMMIIAQELLTKENSPWVKLKFK
ncbi:DUF1266 domain-containing protein [Oceanivirga salmonicida]|uniref:DUF1266 domain-containing protein n=1 Tax=Oceanivirga salmonicida TaxID=1769291 RepID=UPI0008344C74|nr:DUF1266 domain-containing protein [Oceanivirga salmonicida]